jgi:glutathione S-transferase
MRKLGITFDEVRIPLYSDTSTTLLKQHSPSGRVPVLKHNDVIVNDSLAICEYLNDLYPTAHLWPADLVKRAHARSIVAEMHSGFTHLRNNMPMNCRKNIMLGKIDENTLPDIKRITSIWEHYLTQSDGKFLFSEFTIADAFYAPVILRFNTYNIALNDICKKYADVILDMPEINEWVTAAKNESDVLTQFER